MFADRFLQDENNVAWEQWGPFCISFPVTTRELSSEQWQLQSLKVTQKFCSIQENW